jgi:hypothetical protein
VSRLRFAVSLPERALRAAVASLGGVLQESAQVLLPRLVRNSRFYEATAKNALRIAIEAVGGVEPREPQAVPAGEVVRRKAAGNVVELGSIAAFGFSPLWLLAAASDVLHGSRVYLHALSEELKRAGVVDESLEVDSVDGVLAALEGASGRTASLVDVPPLELAELRRSVAEFRADADALPSPEELASLYRGLRATAAAERRPLLEVSQGIGLAFLLSARSVGQTHLSVPYREDWAPLRREGFAAYARRVSRPYAQAVAGHFDTERATLTERVLAKLRRLRRG